MSETPAVRVPTTRRDETADLLHGRLVPDPYRWLEDPDSEDTREWVRQQNEATGAALSALPHREWFTATMRAVVDQPRLGTPLRRAGRYLQTRNDGTQAQDVWYVADSLTELVSGGGRVLVDPNTLSEDGTASIGSVSVSRDGRRVAWTVSTGGSDWQEIRVADLDGAPLADEPVVMTKFCVPTWLPDGRSYLYLAYPEAERADAAGTETGDVGRAHLMRHRLGTDPAQDELVHTDPDQPRLSIHAEVSDDERWLVTTFSVGTERTNRLWVWPLTAGEDGTVIGDPVRLVDTAEAEYEPVAVADGRLLVHTDAGAPLGRITAVDLVDAVDGAPAVWVEVVPEGEDALAAAVVMGDVVVTEHLVDATPVLQRWSLTGELLGRLDVEGGSLLALDGDPGNPEGFVGLSTVTDPQRSWVVDAATGTVTALPRPDSSAPRLDVVTTRQRAVSADGTQVPYFVIRRRDLDGPAPTLLWGYGGFKIPVAADYRPGWSAWLAAGGTVAIANLRGGGEYGSEWYDQGRLAAKQNVFDDFIAVGEHLVSSGVTGPDQLVIHGRSNGGLLVGAVMTQRPDLAAVALPSVGVLDMLRFHRFTIGAAWKSDYGDPDLAEDFEVLWRYSPLHNVAVDTRYPATLVTTGDHDDRVVPLHSHKFVAQLQYATRGEAPVLTRIDTSAGHGAGRPRHKVAAEWADQLAFAAFHTGLVPPTTA
ncbi:prolyl oligopeptidase family serine peptidase [Desertihabitans aurantiacus]|uniref:prolyl oligopeptidase family serine peptidase n=1 Tax=Desertihabitans aurantiacus TaxID=2282477 RepID=UPI001E375011|nr:prolyl oligopeptidase family serine peptidase [Desertihabitans aurantiacus]